MPVLTFVVLNAAAVFVALRVARAAGAGARTSRLVLCGLSGYLILIHTAMLAAGLLRWLTLAGVAIVLALAVVAALWLTSGRARRHEDELDRTRFTPAALFAPLLALATGIAWTWPHVFGATRLWIWDDYTYHMIYPALWLRQHAIAAPAPGQAFTMQAWYPLSASVVAAWFMLPFPGSRGDALAWVSLTAPLYAGIVVGATAELLARVGCRRGAWAVPAVLFATSDRMAVMASSFSDADLAEAAMLFAGFAFAVPRDGDESRRDVFVDAGYAALLTGLAIGVKPTAAPFAAVVLLLIALRAGARALWRVAVVFVTSWVATGGYWYVRNVVHTGDPLYPAAFLWWPGATFPRTTLREYAQHYGFVRTVHDALPVYLEWPFFHAALAVLSLVVVAVWLPVHRCHVAETRARASFTAGALAMTVLMLVLLPAMPYSAGNAMTFASGFVHWDSMRYVALLPLLGWAALGLLLDAGAGAPRWRTFAAIAVATAALLASLMTRHAAPWILAAVVLAAVIAARVPSRAVHRARRIAPIGAAVVAAGVVLWLHGAKAAATAAAVYREPLYGAAIGVLDRQPAGTRVAIFGDQWVYPGFGARDDLTPVRLDGDGRIARAAIGDAMTQGPLTVSPAVFRTNLRDAGIGLVVVVHLPHPGRSPAWPPQHAALEAAGGARLLYRDGAVAIWRLGE